MHQCLLMQQLAIALSSINSTGTYGWLSCCFAAQCTLVQPIAHAKLHNLWPPMSLLFKISLSTAASLLLFSQAQHSQLIATPATRCGNMPA
jgi:hypothetical protein